GPLARPALPLEEPAGDLPDGVHALLVVAREREEVDVLPRRGAHRRHRYDQRVAAADGDRPSGLLGHSARLELQGLSAQGELSGVDHVSTPAPAGAIAMAARGSMKVRAGCFPGYQKNTQRLPGP